MKADDPELVTRGANTGLRRINQVRLHLCQEDKDTVERIATFLQEQMDGTAGVYSQDLYNAIMLDWCAWADANDAVTVVPR